MTEKIETVHTRAEDRLTCPRCGGRELHRIGGGVRASRFRCRNRNYPSNWCGFTFLVSDKELTRAVSR